MFTGLEVKFSLFVSAVALGILLALASARIANSDPGFEYSPLNGNVKVERTAYLEKTKSPP